jgi:4-amino-4-deoxy-L-arabinose transferase-like glycosyltransferase
MKSFTRGSPLLLVLLLLAIGAGALSFAGLEKNPPGFYIDESSISYNAQTIATTGRDENGVSWPLYFRAFGDYKNPVYLYLVAGLFRLTGPGIFAARALSAAGTILAAVVLGLLAKRISRSSVVGILTCIFALLTPWLFEVGRVVIEVAIYPLVFALFLDCVHRAAAKPKWGLPEILPLALTLALLTYTYSIGRVLAPLLAVGLVFFWTRERRAQIIATWGCYALTLIPILVFAQRHPGALTERFRIITYLNPDLGLAEGAWEFVRHYVRNINPWRLLISGDPNRDQIVHIFGTYQFLAAVFVFSMIGLGVVLTTQRHQPWWRFVLYTCAVSLVPASLTTSHFHMLRLIAVPVLLLILTVPGIAWFTGERKSRRLQFAFAALVALTLIQAGIFQWRYLHSADSPRRVHLFDGEYRQKIFTPAIQSKADPIYIADALWIPGYIQAYWYATLEGVPLKRFNRLPPNEAAPVGSIVISTEENCPGCEVLANTSPYTLYVAHERRPRAPLPPAAFRAELVVVSASRTLRAQEPATFRVKVTNRSETTWLARERGGGEYQVALGNHWLDSNGNMLVHDDGRAALLRDLKPGATDELALTVNPPRHPGDYILEIDMLQEGVSWFGLAGSKTVRVPVQVK